MHTISREAAESQLAKLFDHYEIELEKRLKSDNSQAIADEVKDILIRNIMKGRLEIDEDETGSGIKITQRLRTPVGNVSEIHYHEVTGRARTAIKDVDKGSPHQKIYALLAAISKEPQQVFLGMSGVDLTCAETLSTVFSLV